MPIPSIYRAAAALLAATLAAAPSLAAQEPEPAAAVTARNAVVGTGSVGSLLFAGWSFERRFGAAFAAHAGIAWVVDPDFEGEPDLGAAEGLQLGVSLLSGKGTLHNLEVGAGLLYLDDTVGSLGDTRALGTGVLGYRYQRPAGGIIFRLGMMPLFGAAEKGGIELTGYTSFGLAF